MTLRSVNPASEELIAEYDEHDDQEIGRRIERAWKGFLAWRELSGFGIRELVNVKTVWMK